DTQALVMPGEHAPDDLVFLQEDGDGFLFINPRLVSIGLGILRERLLQVGGDADVIDQEAAWLLLENTVDAGNRLHQPMTRIGLSIYIMCMQGASNPVSHMSRTMTSFSGSSTFR